MLGESLLIFQVDGMTYRIKNLSDNPISEPYRVDRALAVVQICPTLAKGSKRHFCQF